jgi:hypothetical protein
MNFVIINIFILYLQLNINLYELIEVRFDDRDLGGMILCICLISGGLGLSLWFFIKVGNCNGRLSMVFCFLIMANYDWIIYIKQLFIRHIVENLPHLLNLHLHLIYLNYLLLALMPFLKTNSHQTYPCNKFLS